MTTTEHPAVTPADLRRYRELSNLSQTAFWGAIGVSQSSGHNYENGAAMPPPVERLVRVHYFAGIPTNASHDELRRIGQMIGSAKSMRRDMKRIEALSSRVAAQAGQVIQQLEGMP